MIALIILAIIGTLALIAIAVAALICILGFFSWAVHWEKE